MFGISFTEIALIAVVALIVVGPQKLPGMLRTVGEWIGKIRRLTTEVRAQTGIDEILRDEGLSGGIHELRSIMRGNMRGVYRPQHGSDPYEDAGSIDISREYPPEGVDAHGALPDDLLDDEDDASGEAVEHQAIVDDEAQPPEPSR